MSDAPAGDSENADGARLLIVLVIFSWPPAVLIISDYWAKEIASVVSESNLFGGGCGGMC